MSTGSGLQCRQPPVYRCRRGPSGARQKPALTAAVAPSYDLQAAVAPDGEPRPSVPKQELNLPLAAALEHAAAKAMTPDQFRGHAAPCQGDADTHAAKSTSFLERRRCPTRSTGPDRCSATSTSRRSSGRTDHAVR